MIRKGIGFILGPFLFMFLIIIMLILGLFSGVTAGITPAVALSEADIVEKYQQTCGALNIPWDMVYLIDNVDAADRNKDNMIEYNPVLTALHFCTIEELVYESKEVPADSEEAENGLTLLVLEVDNEEILFDEVTNTPLPDVTHSPDVETTPEPSDSPEATPTEEPEATATPEPEPEMVTIWILKETNYYHGKDEILEYIGKNKDESIDIKVSNVEKLRNAIQSSADEKNETVEIVEDGETKVKEVKKYISDIVAQTGLDYEKLLKDLKIQRKDRTYIMEMYTNGDIRDMFGDGSQYLPTESALPSDNGN